MYLITDGSAVRVEYWETLKHLKPENLIFLDETGILLGLAITHARSQSGTRVSLLKPFYRAAKITAIGAISINKVLAVMALPNLVCKKVNNFYKN